MFLFEIRYRPTGEWIQIHNEDFDEQSGPAREAFFAMVEDEGEAVEARVVLRATGHIIEERRYDHEVDSV